MQFRTITLSAIAIGLSASTASAALIGVNFVGNGGANGTLSPTDVAGAPGVAQDNFNNLTGGSGTSPALVDETGAATTAILTYAGGGVFQAGNANPVGGDEKMFRGFIFGTTTITATGIPYAQYDVYFYGLNDAAGRTDQVSLNSAPAVSLVSLAPGDAGQVDGNGATPFNYVAGPGTGNYLRFANVTGSSFTLTAQATGNGFTNGIQIVQVPEPAGIAAAGLAVIGLLARRRRV